MQPLVCLMGPTASGKTPLAIELVQRFPMDIISVDSAMVYRGMDIGTAKPDVDTLKRAPHRLIDILDPSEAYSAGRFREDALREIAAIHAAHRIPLLVGGTMLYFRALLQGIAGMPTADANIRANLEARASVEGWEALHAELAIIDKTAADRIHPNDSQRIQRALEVYLLSGKTITAWQATDTNALSGMRVFSFAIAPTERALLHARIAERFDLMLAQGFMEEVKGLMNRGDLSEALPSIRSVGYRQAWAHLSGEVGFEIMREQAIAATRQLAKRQLTWLRTWPGVQWLASEDEGRLAKASVQLQAWLAGAAK
jgi:tRNA dimethylallyltransferase